ncbi:MAG: LptF/LptG family permease [Treponema sp.]|jgi:lipopolysaccharide export system permease protein|nr:LptF/LptG family permease [Treponema sp.]
MTLDRYLVRQFMPIFIIACCMFVMIVILLDLFTNLWRYLNYEVPISQILLVSYYYIPKSFSYALPVSLLFSAGYTLGDLYGRNELTSIFSSGIPFWRFCMPLIVIGVLSSFFAFYFDDTVVIPTLKMKNDLSRKLLHQSNVSENNSDIVIKSKGGAIIYSIDYYDYAAQILNGVNIIEQNEDGSFSSLVRAPSATWNGAYWELSNAVGYQWEGEFLRAKNLPVTDAYTESPDTFRRNAVKAEELPAKETAFLVEDLKAAGLPFITVETDYHHRYSFSCTSFVVMILSISMGGRFRKNILLMTLLSSLSVAAVFYVMDMITMMMAKLGYIPPFAGAWFPVFFFVVAGFFLVRSAKT